MVAGFKSERWPTSNRNTRPASVGIRTRTVIAHRAARPAVGVRAAIGWVGDELVKGRVPGTTPFHGAAIDSGWQIKLVLDEPKKRLSHAAEFGDFVDGEPDRRLNAPVGILLQPVVRLDEADRRRDHEFAATRLLVARGERALP